MSRRRASPQEIAQWRYSVIRPLLVAADFPRLHSAFRGRRPQLVAAVGRRWSLSQRTLYLWMRAWRRGGLAALAPRARSDAGLPRVFLRSPEALDFLLSAALPGPGVDRERSSREIHIAYQRERERREREGEQLPTVSYETFRVWLSRIPDLLEARGNSIVKDGHRA